MRIESYARQLSSLIDEMNDIIDKARGENMVIKLHEVEENTKSMAESLIGMPYKISYRATITKHLPKGNTR